MDPSLCGRCHLCLLTVSPKQPRCELLWLLVGFVPHGHPCALQNPPLLLFINIGAKYSLFKLLVAVQILILGFMFRNRRVGWWGHACPGWEFSIFGSRAAQCLARTWFEGENEKKNESSSSLGDMVTLCVCQSSQEQDSETALHRQQVWAERVKMGIYPKSDGEGRVASGTYSAGLAAGLGR